MKKTILSLFVVFALMFSCSCGKKNPLEGTWKADYYGELEITDVKISIDEDTFKLEGINDSGDYVGMTLEYDMDDSKIYFTDFVDYVMGDIVASRDYPEQFENLKDEFAEAENFFVSYNLLRKTLVLGGGEDDELFPEELKLTK